MPTELARAVDAIFFDYDGVVVESVAVKTEAFRRLFADFGDDIARQVVAFHSANLGMSRYVKFEHFYANFLGLPLSEQERDDLDARFTAFVEEGMRDVPMVAGCEAFLQRHCPPLQAFVVSATPQRDIGTDIQARGLDPHFAGAYGSPTSKADHIARLLASNSLAPTRCVMVGDARVDLEAALANGIGFVARHAPGTPDVFGNDVEVVVPDLTNLDAAIVRAMRSHARG